MRLSGITMFGQQNGLINVDRVNQSVSKQSSSAKDSHIMQMGRDRVTFSPQGKTANLIERLNKQKASILERRDQFLEQARKRGQSNDMIKPQLEQFDQQIKDIDQQIQEAVLQKMKDAAEESAPKVKSSKSKTKQDIQNDIMANITEASATLDRIDTVSSEKNKLDGNADVLKSEIELDRSRDSTGSGREAIAAKEERVAQMQSRAQGLMQDIGDSMDKANEILEENHDLSASKPAEDDKDADKVNDQNIDKSDHKLADEGKAADVESASSKQDGNRDLQQRLCEQ